MSKNWRAFARQNRRAVFSAVTVFAVGAAALFAPVEPAHARSKRVLFASTDQCRQLSQANLETCCYALNSRLVLSRQQRAMCPPSTTAAIGSPTSQSTHEKEGGHSSEHATNNGARHNGGGTSGAGGNTGGTGGGA